MSDHLPPPCSKKYLGICLLPNLFTIASMFAGFYAIIAGLQGRFELAVIAIFIALLCDGLDGRVARWTGSESELGAQLDSLADMVSFGVAPAILAYSWSLSVLGKPGWLTAFIYMVCTSLRLARFNSQDQSEEKRFFFGLNTPSAAAFIAATLWLCITYEIDGITMAVPMVILLFTLALLKVSRIPYRSFTDFDLRRHVPMTTILIAIFLLVLITLAPPQTLFIFILTYVLSGPFAFLYNKCRRKHS